MSNKVFCSGTALIPARNEEAHLAGLVRELRKTFATVTVVADNCDDRTAAVAAAAGATVLERRGPGGKGAAVRHGLARLPEDCAFVLLLDGDGQHDPAEAARFIAAWQEGGADLIIGNRTPFRRPMPALRRLTNRFMSSVVSAVTGKKIRDSQCGFRLLSRRLFSLSDWRTECFEIETEMIFRAVAAGLTVAEVPITTRYAGAGSRISAWRDGWRWLWFVMLFLRLSRRDKM